MPKRLEGDFDYIVVGAGTAGCIMANRLSADPGNRVLILEAGGDDNWIWFHIPVGYLFAIGNPRSDWMFKTEPEPGLNGRALAYPRGKVIGGCSAINAMISMRGRAADYDHWHELFPRQPEARPALVVGARLPQARTEPPQSAAREARAGRPSRYRAGPRRGRAVHPERRDHRSSREARGGSLGRLDRLGPGAAS